MVQGLEGTLKVPRSDTSWGSMLDRPPECVIHPWTGRWGRERYEGAVAALVHILRKMQAVRPDACVLRPVLREEARKAIGAACLLLPRMSR